MPAIRTPAAVNLACDASARDSKSLAMWVERCEPLSTYANHEAPAPPSEEEEPQQKAPQIQKNSRRLELSISKSTLHGRWGQGPGSVDPRFPAGLPFPVSEILEFVAFRDSG